jgi:hypothetical protein
MDIEPNDAVSFQAAAANEQWHWHWHHKGSTDTFLMAAMPIHPALNQSSYSSTVFHCKLGVFALSKLFISSW